jgi:ubiquitin carboxyl-terminal hydrolase 22/27/51
MQCCQHPNKARPRACGHLGDALKTGMKPAIAHAMRVARVGEHSSLDESACVRCDVCGGTDGMLHMCVECQFVGCFRRHGAGGAGDRHIKSHLARSGHRFAVSLGTTHIYCGACGDFVHNKDAELLSQNERASAVSQMLDEQEPDAKRVPYAARSLQPRDAEALREHAQRLGQAAAHFAGLRGLLNLGSTCFLNAIMQAGFVHNPVVRNFFLADMHNSAACNASGCLMCQVDRFFSEMFSPSQLPFACSELLCAVWQHSDYLAGYEQQDAHEFLISLLNGLHTHSAASAAAAAGGGGGVAPGTPIGGGRCSCVAHQSFGSVLCSECTCSSCGHVSASMEPCLDLSLQIPETMRDAGPVSLESCLAGFTQPEVLGSEDRLKCERCGSYQQARKQMSLESPPVILCLQIKRFQRTMGARKMVSSKVETAVSFPAELDVLPFLSKTVRPNAGWQTAKKPRHCLSSMYDLFGVVNHHGSLDNGHYTSYVLQQMGSSNEWIKCDDAMLTRVSAREVHESQCYLLFYCKRFLEYE